MKKQVVWSGNSRAHLAAIDRETALRILRAIDEFLTTGSGDVVKLRPPKADLRLRVGDYRIFFRVTGPAAIEILGIKHRSQAY